MDSETIVESLRKLHPENEYRISPTGLPQRNFKYRWNMVCKHDRIHRTCVECGGAAICYHGRQHNRCKECGGGSICQHKRIRSTCEECGGGSICEHKKIRSTCKECDGGSVCQHKKRRSTCKECDGGSVCQHKKLRRGCKECTAITCKKCDIVLSRSSFNQHNKTIHRKCDNCGLEGCTHSAKIYCRPCSITLLGKTPQKKRELQVVDFVEKLLGDRDSVEIYYDKMDPEITGCSKLRADVRIVLPFRTIILEIDENQHNADSYSCTIAEISSKAGDIMPIDKEKRKRIKEDSRMSQMATSGIVTNQVFIRFNPDCFRDDENKIRKVPIEKRLERLDKELTMWMKEETTQEHLCQVVFLYYSGQERSTDYVPMSPEELKAKASKNNDMDFYFSKKRKAT